MRLTRRTFLKMAAASAAAMSLNSAQVQNLYKAIAAYPSHSYHVIWFQGQSCSGDSTAFLQLLHTFTESAKPGGNTWQITPGSIQIEDIVLDIVDLEFHPTVMGPAGTSAVEQLKSWYNSARGTDSVIVIVEGSIPVDAVDRVGDNACIVGSEADGTEITLKDAFVNVATDALAIIGLGQCASFGGVPKAASDYRYDRSGAMSAQEVASLIPAADRPPVVNVPGCPTNPWWLFDTIVLALTNVSALAAYQASPTAANLQAIVTALSLDEFYRPGAIYGGTIHGGDCSRYQDYLSRIFQDSPGDYIVPGTDLDPNPGPGQVLPGANESYAGGCLKKVGCKGMASHALCAKTFSGTGQLDYADKGKGLWADDPGNTLAGTGWTDVGSSASTNSACILDNAPCQACTEKGFPDRFSPFIEY